MVTLALGEPSKLGRCDLKPARPSQPLARRVGRFMKAGT
jgi:hypothetical protein